jgi:hypothetical protein
VQRVEHVDEFAGRFGIEHGLSGSWIGVGAQDHGGVAAEHANEVFKGGRALGDFGWWSGRNWFRGVGCWRWGMPRGLASCFALFFFDHFFAQFTFSGEWAPVDNAKTFVLFRISLLRISQGSFLNS